MVIAKSFSQSMRTNQTLHSYTFTSFVDYPIKKIARWFFEMTNINRHKQITICGIKIKVRMKKREMVSNIREQLYYQSAELKILENKISELQKELILAKK